MSKLSYSRKEMGNLKYVGGCFPACAVADWIILYDAIARWKKARAELAEAARERGLTNCHVEWEELQDAQSALLSLVEVPQ